MKGGREEGRKKGRKKGEKEEKREKNGFSFRTPSSGPKGELVNLPSPAASHFMSQFTQASVTLNLIPQDWNYSCL